MTLVVQKYGGSSLADAESMQRVARRIVATREAGKDVAVVVSAMGDTTDELLDLANAVTDAPTARELDMLLSAGERISMALLAMTITDVDGLFSADPRVVTDAHRLSSLSTEEALELAAHGAKILHLRSVELARRYGVPLHVRCSFTDNAGTWVTDDPGIAQAAGSTPDPEDQMEDALVRGLAHSHDLSKLTVVGVPDVPGSAAAIFAVISEAVSAVDMIGQTHTAEDTGLIDFSFALPSIDAHQAAAALRASQAGLGFRHVTLTDEVGKVSVVGAGLRSSPEVSAQLFRALSEARITIHLISTSEIRLSVVVEDSQVEEATRVLHRASDLTSGAAQPDALVHAGTGR